LALQSVFAASTLPFVAAYVVGSAAVCKYAFEPATTDDLCGVVQRNVDACSFEKPDETGRDKWLLLVDGDNYLLRGLALTGEKQSRPFKDNVDSSSATYLGQNVPATGPDYSELRNRERIRISRSSRCAQAVGRGRGAGWGPGGEAPLLSRQLGYGDDEMSAKHETTTVVMLCRQFDRQFSMLTMSHDNEEKGEEEEKEEEDHCNCNWRGECGATVNHRNESSTAGRRRKHKPPDRRDR
uniref:Cytochrome b5 heme-binding domain-containing protein n=1 Tax=Soboliphyme baturini TaxID=241478 RepID=A0A183IZ01_9BILA